MPANEHNQAIILIDGRLVPLESLVDAPSALLADRKALIEGDSGDLGTSRDRPTKTLDSPHLEELLGAVRETVQNPLKTLIIHGHSEASIARALAEVFSQLSDESTSRLYFSTLQFRADPTLRVLGVVDEQWEGPFPFGSLHVNLEPSTELTSAPQPSTTTPSVANNRQSSMRKTDAEEADLAVCPRCGHLSGRQRVWHAANQRLGFAGLFDKRLTRRGAEMRRLIAMAPYDCAICLLTFGTPECTPVLLMGARRSGVTTLTRALGVGVTGDRSSTLLGIRESSTVGRSAFELRDFEGRSWLLLDEGSEERSRATLAALASAGKKGLLLYLADPTQFAGSSNAEDRPGFPREVVTGMRSADTLAPDWQLGLVVTKCDRFIDAQDLTGSRQQAHSVLQAADAGQLVVWVEGHQDLMVGSVGDLQRGTSGVPSATLLAVASMLRGE